MKTTFWNRLTTGWSFMRIFYMIMGVTIIIQAGMIQQWPGIILGAYFLVMGVLGLGCASGNCAYVPPAKTENNGEISFEEIKHEHRNNK